MTAGVDFDSVGQPKAQAKGVDFDSVGHPTAHPHGGVDFDSVATHGNYSFDGLKKLWVQAGGDPKHADIMAHVAEAESAGDPNAHNQYVENGKTYHVRGLWQVSDIHGDQAASNDPMTNARSAVALFKAQGFEPWDASKHNWGKYLDPNHYDPGDPRTQKPQPLKKLPPGGMPAVLGAHTTVPFTEKMYQGFLDTVADGMEGIIKNVAGVTAKAWGEIAQGEAEQHGTRGSQYRGQTPGQISKPGAPPNIAGFGAAPPLPEPLNRVQQKVTSRLSPIVRQIGEAGDVGFEAAEAGLRHLAGDDTAWNVFNRDYPSVGAMLDAEGPYILNSPQSIGFWAKQPGLMDKLHEAQPSSPMGQLAAIALGIHADLARLKPGHPYLTGAETTGLELANLAYIGAGKLGAAGKLGVLEELQAARAGKYGETIAKAARATADSPVLGNRFWRMGDESGIVGENAHARWARNVTGAYPEAQDTFTAASNYAGLNQPQQVELDHLIEHLDAETGEVTDPRFAAIADKKVGGLSMRERAMDVITRSKATENDLRTVAPIASKRFIQGNYVSHDGAFKMQYDSGPNAARGGGVSNPLGGQRIHATLQDGLDKGLELDPEWVPAGAQVLHEGKMRQFIAWMTGLRRLETLPMKEAGDEFHSFDIPYKAPLDAFGFDQAAKAGSSYSGALQDLGEGAAGYKKMLAAADKYAAERAQQRLVQEGLDDSKLPALTASAKAAYIARVRKIFSDKYPKHVFDAADFLGAPDVQGKAISRAGLDAAIDVHPNLSKAWADRGKSFDRWSRENPPPSAQAIESGLVDPRKWLGDNADLEAAHDAHPPAETQSSVYQWLDFMNGAVRQGQVLGVGYHGFFNLAPNAATRLKFKRWPMLATALGLNPLQEIPSSWLDALDASGAVQKGVGGVGGIPTRQLVKMLTVPFKDFKKPSGALSPAAIGIKAYTNLARWSQNIAFHYQERRIGAVLYHYLMEDEDMTPAAAAREVSQMLNDSHNLTRGLERDHLRHWAFFYGWTRRGLRLATRTAIEEPRKIMAPLRGVQTADELQGDEGAVSGTALSLRSAGDALQKLTGIKGLGTDAHGNPRYIDIPSFWSFGSSMARFLGGGALLAAGGNRDDVLDPAKVVAERSMSNLTPLAGIGLRALITMGGPDAAMPEPYNNVLFDRDAPNPGTMMWQAAQKIGEQYAPIPTRSATFGLGPNTYTAPNSSRVTKAQAGAMKEMRNLLVDANKAGDHDLASQIYEQMNLINGGDARALANSRMNVARWGGMLGVRTSPFRSRYTPRY